ncbi:MAG: Hsp20/alpha crystallin family protein [Verrucomicrobiae bacterium]|nr:Hsp20/alpha crystallin family protein [Verrucomicrobiae bacterium]
MSDKNLEKNVNVTSSVAQNCDCSPAPKTDRVFRIPRADIYQNGDNVELELDMPGVSKENVQISLEGNVLTLTGRVNEAPSEWALIHCESLQRDYQRAFELGADVDLDNIKATMNAGVLRVTLPKMATAKPRKIEVTA